jgi:hypothetical protein
MARKIYVSSDMSIDERLIGVTDVDPLIALLWPWLLTAFDDWGRLAADPRRLKFQVFPANALVPVEVIANALSLFAEAGLITLYTVDCKQYAAIEPGKWFKYQTHIREAKRQSDGSRCPPPPDDIDALERADARDDALQRADARDLPPSPSPSPSLPPSPPPSGSGAEQAFEFLDRPA